MTINYQPYVYNIKVLKLVILSLVLSMALCACDDDKAPDNEADMKELLVGTWVLHNNEEATGAYTFNADGSGEIVFYSVNRYPFRWTYTPSSKVLNLNFGGSMEGASWKIIKIDKSHMTIEDLNRVKDEELNDDDPFARYDKIR